MIGENKLCQLAKLRPVTRDTVGFHCIRFCTSETMGGNPRGDSCVLQLMPPTMPGILTCFNERMFQDYGVFVQFSCLVGEL